MECTPQNIETMRKIVWVPCDQCEAWVHCVCVNLREEDAEDTTFKIQHCVYIFLFFNHIIVFCKSLPLYRFRHT